MPWPLPAVPSTGSIEGVTERPNADSAACGIDPGEESQAMTLRILEPDLAIAFLVILDQLPDGDTLIDQPTTLAFQVLHLEDESDLPRPGREPSLPGPLHAQGPLPAARRRELVLRVQQDRSEAQGVDVPSDRRLPARDPDHRHEQVELTGPRRRVRFVLRVIDHEDALHSA